MNAIFTRYGIAPALGWGIVFLPIAIVASAIGLRENPSTEAIMRHLSLENHPIELITFASLLLAGGLGIRLSTQMGDGPDRWLHAGFYCVFGIGLIFTAMEEISWGQWFVHYETPEAVRAINKQGEMKHPQPPVVSCLLRDLAGSLWRGWADRDRAVEP